MRRFLPFAALLGVAFVLGCQDVGTGVVASDGLVPQFDKKGTGDCATKPHNLHCHGDVEEPTEDPIYTVKATGDIFSVGTNITDGEDGLYEASGYGPQAMDFQLDISFILDADPDAVTCGLDEATDLRDPLIGNFMFGDFLSDYIVIFFDHNKAQHHFLSPAGVGGLDDLPETWPPTVDDGPVTVTQSTGEWTMYTKGKNHREGCTGEGGPGSIKWEAEVTNITGT